MACSGKGKFLCANGLELRCSMYMGSCSGCGWPGFSTHEERNKALKAGKDKSLKEEKNVAPI